MDILSGLAGAFAIARNPAQNRQVQTRHCNPSKLTHLIIRNDHISAGILLRIARAIDGEGSN